MYREKRKGRSTEEALAKCTEALKERLWREVWSKEIEVRPKRVRRRELEGGEVEVEVEL